MPTETKNDELDLQAALAKIEDLTKEVKASRVSSRTIALVNIGLRPSHAEQIARSLATLDENDWGSFIEDYRKNLVEKNQANRSTAAVFRSTVDHDIVKYFAK